MLKKSGNDSSAAAQEMRRACVRGGSVSISHRAMASSVSLARSVYSMD